MNNTNVNNLLKRAIDEVSNLESGEKFLVKDLFKGYEWKRYVISHRLNLGVLFLNYVKENEGIIKILNKTSSNQQMYEKI